MTGSLLIPDGRIDDLLADVAELDRLNGAPIVAVSAAMYAHPKGSDKARYAAALRTAESSQLRGFPHIFMLDNSSPDEVATALRQVGGIVVPVRHDTEGGLARPHITGARLIDRINPGALMIKCEPEKDLFADYHNHRRFFEARERFDVITGVRSPGTLTTMPYYLRLTEAILATAIRDLTGTYDAASGILALTARGRQIFCQTTDPAWQYLIKTPFTARLADVPTGEVEINFDYHEMVVAEENGNPAVDAKRRQQFELMLGCAIETAGGTRSLSDKQLQTVASARSALDALERMAKRI